MMTEEQLVDAIGSLRRTSQRLRAEKRLDAALDLEAALADRQSEFTALRAA